MIVVVGVPAWRAAEPPAPAGRACEIALAAVRRGARVELVGRAGDDPAGDALLISLAAAGVGHVAMLRDPARATPVLAPMADADEDAPIDLVGAAGPAAGTSHVIDDGAPRLDAADVGLGLEYLTSFRVLVVVDDVPGAVVPTAAEAAGFAGAHLVLLLPPGAAMPDPAPVNATVMAAPEGDDGGAFARLVGDYAAALDAGATPAEAFAAAAAGSGWEAIRATG